MTLLDILPLKITGSKEEVMEQFLKVKELSDEDRKSFLKLDLYQLNNNISRGFEIASFKFNYYRFISEYLNPLIDYLLFCLEKHVVAHREHLVFLSSQSKINMV